MSGEECPVYNHVYDGRFPLLFFTKATKSESILYEGNSDSAKYKHTNYSRFLYHNVDSRFKRLTIKEHHLICFKADDKS